MLLDFSLVTPSHPLYFGFAFLLVFSSLAWFLKNPSRFLRPVPSVSGAHYAGAILIGAVMVLSYLALDDLSLKIGLAAAGFFALLIGIKDENKPLSAGEQLVWQVVIVVLAVSWGWVIRYVSNPLGEGLLFLDQPLIGALVWPGSLITVVWLLLLMNAMNWLDGIDGLSSGVGTVAFLALAAVALLPSIYDATTQKLALIGAGAFLGFLHWNFPKARVYLGTTGSWFLGLFLGLVALYSGGKIITTFLVLALPLLDLIYVSIQRILKRQPPWQGDTVTHLHHRLLARGYSTRTITLGAIAVTLLLGFLAIALPTGAKALALSAAAIMLVITSSRLFAFHD